MVNVFTAGVSFARRAQREAVKEKRADDEINDRMKMERMSAVETHGNEHSKTGSTGQTWEAGGGQELKGKSNTLRRFVLGNGLRPVSSKPPTKPTKLLLSSQGRITCLPGSLATEPIDFFSSQLRSTATFQYKQKQSRGSILRKRFNGETEQLSRGRQKLTVQGSTVVSRDPVTRRNCLLHSSILQ
jgi:hypothetical protein